MAIERSLPHLRSSVVPLSRQRLWLQVLIGMALGVALGVVIGPTGGLLGPRAAVLVGNWVGLPGKLFLLAIQFVVVPLVVASVVRGIAAGEGADNLGRLGGLTVGFFILTTLLAVGIGIAAALAIGPGQFVEGASLNAALSEGMQGDAAAAVEQAVGQTPATPTPEALPELIVSLFPRDPLTTFISGNMLQIVLTAVIFGIALVKTPVEQRRPLLDLLASVQAACMTIVGMVLRFAPFAVFGLLANITARVGLSALIGLSAYVLTVLVGLLVLFGAYVAIAFALAGRSPRQFIGASREAMLLAFSTSSSAAVMPVSLTTAEQKLNVRAATARFVVPLGTTINMGGTALYQGVATLFLAQVFDVDIGMFGMLLVVVMATGAAIGSPGTPGVGIVILATILTSVGIPAAGIAIILGVDRLLDMCRTVINVTGDLVACVVIDHMLGGPKEVEQEHLGRVPTPAMPELADPLSEAERPGPPNSSSGQG